MCVCVCLCLPLEAIITIGVILTPCNWLNKFYSFSMSAILSIISRHGLRNEARHRNQPNKSKLALYKPLIHFYSHSKQLYTSNKTEHFSCKGGCGMCRHIHISRQLKEELTWATDKQLKVISNIMLFKRLIPLRNVRVKLF